MCVSAGAFSKTRIFVRMRTRGAICGARSSRMSECSRRAKLALTSKPSRRRPWQSSSLKLLEGEEDAESPPAAVKVEAESSSDRWCRRTGGRHRAAARASEGDGESSCSAVSRAAIAETSNPSSRRP